MFRMQRAVPFHTDEIYHIFNRGAHKEKIFRDDRGRQRFQALLLICNRRDPVHLGNLLTKYKGPSFIKLFSEQVPKERDRLVDVLAYCLMPNHFHIVMRQRRAGGITTLMRKVGTAYSMYFNAKHDHSGTLLQGRFKSEHIDTERYLRWIFQYVHLNPLDIFESKWREVGLKDTKGAEHFIANYRWSSHLDYSALERSEQSILTMDDVYDKLDFNDALQFIREDKTVL